MVVALVDICRKYLLVDIFFFDADWLSEASGSLLEALENHSEDSTDSQRCQTCSQMGFVWPQEASDRLSKIHRSSVVVFDDIPPRQQTSNSDSYFFGNLHSEPNMSVAVSGDGERFKTDAFLTSRQGLVRGNHSQYLVI